MGLTLSKTPRQQHTDLQVDHLVVTPKPTNRDITNIPFSIWWSGVSTDT